MNEVRFPSLVIWVVALWLLMGAASVLSGVLVYFGGTMSDKDALVQMQSLGVLYWILSTAIGLFNIIGATLLVFLRRQAFYVVAAAFGLTLASIALLAANGQLQTVFGRPPELYALPVSLILGLTVLGYLWFLARRGDLT